jgi:hypothetical protein
MSCGDKAWAPLIGLTGYINYSSSLVARQFEGVQYVPRTWGLAEYTGPFKEASSLDKLDAIRNDWKQPVLVYNRSIKKSSHLAPIIQYGGVAIHWKYFKKQKSKGESKISHP